MRLDHREAIAPARAYQSRRSGCRAHSKEVTARIWQHAVRGTDQNGKLRDADLRQRIAMFEMKWRAFSANSAAVADESKSGNGVSVASSILKIAGTKFGQERSDCRSKSWAMRGIGLGEGRLSPDELRTTRGWLGGQGHDHLLAVGRPRTCESPNGFLAPRTTSNQDQRNGGGAEEQSILPDMAQGLGEQWIFRERFTALG